jgi:ABC-type branched-subunit amino acid transport system ATPase component
MVGGPASDAAVAQMSFVDQKLTELARALATGPVLLLVDEPAAGMEADGRNKLAAVLRRVNHERGITIIVIEHDVDFLNSICDRLLVLDQGHVVAHGRPDEAAVHHAIQETYQGAVVHNAEQVQSRVLKHSSAKPVAPARVGPPLLALRHLVVSYAGHHPVIKGITLALNPGEVIGLFGPNKAGKTTLARCLAGALPVDGGLILLDGHDVSGLPAAARLALGICLCPEGRGIYPGLSVRENLRLSADHLADDEFAERSQQVLQYFRALYSRDKLKKRLEQRAGTLSGGEAQMLGIARRLIRQKTVFLIIDEPSLGLAPKAFADAMDAVSAVHRERGVTVLLIEEAPTRLTGRVDYAYLLDKGLIQDEGTVEELTTHQAVARAFHGEIGAQVLTERAGSGDGELDARME